MLDLKILKDFASEGKQLLSEMETFVEQMEDSEIYPAEALKEYANRIDRIMGVAKTLSEMDPSNLGLRATAAFAETGKTLGYKASAITDSRSAPVIGAFLGDLVEVVHDILNQIENNEAVQQILTTKGQHIKKRLQWLQGKINSEIKVEVGALGQVLGKAKV